MAKTKRKVAPEPEVLELKYDLYSLPTAQHKAGLAGLLMMIESMKARKLSPLPKISDLTAAGVKITFTRESMQTVFDDLYAAAYAEVEVKAKWAGQRPKRAIERKTVLANGKQKTEKRFIYNVVQPAGRFLAAWYPAGDDLWLKLWRDMVWSTLRGRPTTRGVYKERADGKPSSVAPATWASLAKSGLLRARGKLRTEPIASSVFIGAQDVNAEKVPFQGTPEDNMLLHFWTLPTLIFAPSSIDRDGKTESAGYALAIPEPADLCAFVEEVQRLLRSLDPAPAGFRPRAARIDLPAEGGLEYLSHLARARVRRSALAETLAAVEVYQLKKRGNSIPVLSAERILPDERVLRDYETLRQQCRNPLYRSQRIMNLLRGMPWYHGMDTAFNQYPWEFFIWKSGSERATPRYIPFFGYDTSRKFRAIEAELTNIQGGVPMSDQDKDDLLARRVYHLIQGYVRQRAEGRSGEKYEKFRGNKDDKGRVVYPAKYSEAVQRICTDAFLAMRGRRDKDFVEYFTGTICSVPQYLPEDDFLAVSQALATDCERIKTLAMLALSANSFYGREKEEES